ncbi:MAG: Transcriptional regulatory protein BasR [Bacteroidetes bacterium ADurb.Bin174]|nr:MAG: Transcriptional regulatory protein BasR [Bacteroidetes bacterium ADurb.Bin174]
MKKILIIEDDISIAQLIQLELEESGYETFWADTFQKADNVLENQIINLMIVGFKLSADANSCDWIRSRKSKKLLIPPFIISTEQLNERVTLEIKKLGARDYLLKDSTLISCMANIVKRALKEIEQEEKIALSKQALKENETKYRMLFERNPEPMFIVNEDLQFLEVNGAAVKHYGYSRKEFLALTFTGIRPQEDIQLLHERVKQILNKKKLIKYVSRHVKKNGELIVVETTSALIRWKGQIAAHILINDITEKTKTQEKLQQKRIRLRRVLEESTRFIQVQSGKIDFVKITDIMMEISGAKVVAFSRFIDDGGTYITKGFSGLGNFAKNSMNILGFNLLEKVWKADLTFSSTLKDGNIQYLNNIKELKNRIFSTTIIQIITDSFNVGEIVLVPVMHKEQLMAVFTLIFKKGDVFSDAEVIELFSNQVALYIARVRAERAMLKGQEKYRYLFENNPQPMMIVDVESLLVLEVNKAALELYGYTKEEFLKLKLLDLRSAEEVSALIDSLSEFKKDVEMNMTTIHQTKNNDFYQVELSSTPIIFEDKKARHLLIIKHTKLEK